MTAMSPICSISPRQLARTCAFGRPYPITAGVVADARIPVDAFAPVDGGDRLVHPVVALPHLLDQMRESDDAVYQSVSSIDGRARTTVLADRHDPALHRLRPAERAGSGELAPRYAADGAHRRYGLDPPRDRRRDDHQAEPPPRRDGGLLAPDGERARAGGRPQGPCGGRGGGTQAPARRGARPHGAATEHPREHGRRRHRPRCARRIIYANREATKFLGPFHEGEQDFASLVASRRILSADGSELDRPGPTVRRSGEPTFRKSSC